MKIKCYTFALISFVVVACLCASTLLIQGEEQKPQLYFIEVDLIKPSMVNEFESYVKEWLAQATKHKFPYSWYTFDTDLFYYIFAFPINDFTDMDTMEMAWDEIIDKIGVKQWREMIKDYDNYYKYEKSFFIRFSPGLSYVPDKTRLESEEKRFVVWDLAYIQPNRQKEAVEIITKINSLLKSRNIPDEVIRLIGETGTEMPVYINMMFGKDPADFWTHNQEMRKLLRKDIAELHQEWVSLFRKFETKQGWFRPDLSYISKKK
jgi:hypothetical protein